MRRLGQPADIANGVQLLRLGAVRLGHRPGHRDRRRERVPVTAPALDFGTDDGPLPRRAGRARRHPHRQPGRRPRHDARRRALAGGPAGVRERPGRADRGPPGRPRRVARRARRARPCSSTATTTSSRPGAEAEWTSPPFELVVEGDVARGRGVTDDKGPVYIALQTARAFMAQEGALPLNVKFLLEGEEEIGSPHLAGYVDRPRRRAGRRPGHLGRRGDVAAGRAVPLGRVQGPGQPGHRRHRRPVRPALGPLRRHGRQPAARARRDPGQPARRRRAGRRPRLLRRHPAADGRPAGRDRRRALRRGGLPARARPGGAARRARLLDPRAALGAAHAGGQRGHRRRQVHGDPARGGRPPVRAAWSPARIPARSWPRSPRHVRRTPSGGSRGAGAPGRGADPGLHDRARPPGDPGGAAPRSPRSTPGRRCCSRASAARCRPPTCSSGCSAPRRCSSPSPPPTRTCTHRTSSCGSRGCARGCGRGKCYGGSWPRKGALAMTGDDYRGLLLPAGGDAARVRADPGVRPGAAVPGSAADATSRRGGRPRCCATAW